MEKHDTKNMIKVIDVLVEVGNIIPPLLKAKSLMQKATILSALSDEIFSIITLDVAQLKLEWSDFSAQEKEQITTHVKQKFDIEDDKLESTIESIIEAGIKQIDLIKTIVELSKQLIKKEAK